MSEEEMVVFELTPTEKAYLSRLDGRRKNADLMARDIIRCYIVTEARKEARSMHRKIRHQAKKQAPAA